MIKFANAEMGRPFEWGETNCVALAVRWLDQIAGTTVLPRYRHCMSSAARAAAWSRKHGVNGLCAVLVEEGFSRVDPAFAQPGDVWVSETQDGQIAAHILIGAQLLSSTQADGVLILPIDAVAKPLMAIGWRPA